MGGFERLISTIKAMLEPCVTGAPGYGLIYTVYEALELHTDIAFRVDANDALRTDEFENCGVSRVQFKALPREVIYSDFPSADVERMRTSTTRDGCVERTQTCVAEAEEGRVLAV